MATASIWQLLRDLQYAGGEEQVARMAALTQALALHTAIPGIIESFDAASQTASVKPAIKCLYAPSPDAEMGDSQFVEHPLCVDVPVVFPSGGGYTLTFPVAQGDECLLVFSERAIDYWHEVGGVQEPSELRHHDLSDAVAFVGIRSKARKLANFNSQNAELRSDDGAVKLTIDSGGTVTIKSTNMVLDGNVHVTGTVHCDQDVFAQTVSLHEHTHIENTGKPTYPPTP